MLKYKLIIVILILIIISYLVYLEFFITPKYTSINIKDQWNLSQTNISNLLNTTQPKCIKGCIDTKSTKLFQEIYTIYHDIRAKNTKVIKNISTSIGPLNVFIMRHADRQKNQVSLDCNGIYKSTFIPDMIDKLNSMDYNIDYIITANPNITDGSMHIEQTVLLTSWLLNIPLFIFGSSKEYENTIQQIYSNKIFNGKNILICWQHTCIQGLLYSLLTIGPQVKNIPNQSFLTKSNILALPYWNEDNYQTVIHIDEEFNETIYNSGIKTCAISNNELTFGKAQKC